MSKKKQNVQSEEDKRNFLNQSISLELYREIGGLQVIM